MIPQTITDRAILYRTSVLVLTWLASSAGHEAGDYLEQPDRVSQIKQDPGVEGVRALNRHIGGYTAVQLAMKAITYMTSGVRVPVHAVLAGQAAESALHWIIDRGPALRAYADITDKRRFHDLNTGGVNGRMLLDQAAHKAVQIPLGAIITALCAGRAHKA